MHDTPRLSDPGPRKPPELGRPSRELANQPPAIGLALIVALALGGASAHAGERGQEIVVAVHIASRVSGSGEIADTRPRRARADVGVTLFAVVETERGRERRFYSDAAAVTIRGRVRAASPMDRSPHTALSWHKVEPAIESMSNQASGSFRFEPIAYREVAVAEWANRTRVAADVVPTLTRYRGPPRDRGYRHGVGTMRYKLVARTPHGPISSPGAEARRGRGSGGLSDRVHRVSLRRDDSYLGFMTEMYGQPYIWASAGSSPGTHQSERLEGADCADLMVYGMRRLGHDIPYTWTGGLHPYVRTLSAGTRRPDGVYVDARGEPVRFPGIGDLILFPRHVGALAGDRGVPGVLDSADLMMHTLFGSPREQPIGATHYADMPIEIARWKRRRGELARRN